MTDGPRIEIDTYADHSPAIVVYVPDDPGGCPIEEIGGEELLRRYVAFPDLLAACRMMLGSPGLTSKEKSTLRSAIAQAEKPLTTHPRK